MTSPHDEISRLQKELDSCDRRKLELFELYHEKKLTTKEFISEKARITDRQQELRKELEDASSEAQSAYDSDAQRYEDKERLRAMLDAAGEGTDELRRSMYASIERVDVFKGAELRVKWAFEDLFRHLED